MSRLRLIAVQLFALACVFLGTPGMTEVARDAATAFGLEAAPEPADEECCSGMEHHCVCCGHVYALAPDRILIPLGGQPLAACETPPPLGEARPGFPTPPFRPPAV